MPPFFNIYFWYYISFTDKKEWYYYWDDIINSGKNFIETGKNGLSNNIANASDSEVQSIIENIYSIIFPLGVVITVIVGVVLGIKFMLASAEEKAKVKELMVPYVIGCAVIYGAFGIWRIVIEILSAVA